MFIRPTILSTLTDRDKLLHHRVTEMGFLARKYINTLPKDERPTFNCHSICRAIARAIPELTFVDGSVIGLKREQAVEGNFKFKYVLANHTWLVTPDDLIIDPYPVGVMTAVPIILASKGDNEHFGAGLYIADSIVTTLIPLQEVEARAEVLYALIQKALAEKPMD